MKTSLSPRLNPSVLSLHPNLGLTLVECLAAILIVGIVSAAMAPPLLMIAATRVQNTRIDQATALARGQVDRVRTIVEQGGSYQNDLPPVSSVTATINNPDALSSQPVMTSSEACNGFATSATVGCTRTFNDNEFIIQTFRGAGSSFLGKPVAFPMQVRVYSSSVFDNGGSPSSTLPVTQTPATFTAFPGAQRLPLVVLTTNVIRGDLAATLCQIGTCE